MHYHPKKMPNKEKKEENGKEEGKNASGGSDLPLKKSSSGDGWLRLACRVDRKIVHNPQAVL